MSEAKLFRPDAVCPDCGRPPRLGFTKRQLEKWAQDPPAAIVQTYQCSFERRPGVKCNSIYRIRAGDLHRARPLETDTVIRG